MEYETPDETYYNVRVDEEILASVDEETILVNDERHPTWGIEPVLEKDVINFIGNDRLVVDNNEVINIVENVVKKAMRGRELRFWEVYVDKGQLADYLSKYDDVVASTFSLPEWDFSIKEVREQFINLIKRERPHFIWLAPPCTKWSPMQRINIRCLEDEWKLCDERELEEKSHLEMVADTFNECKEIDAGAAMEHPDGAESWSTKAMEKMRGYFEAVTNRCRTGLLCVQHGKVLGKVRKRTRIRTLSRQLGEAMDLRCLCGDVPHVQMIGKSKALKEMQNYEVDFVRRAAEAIYVDMEQRWLQRQMVEIMVAEEVDTEMSVMNDDGLEKDDWKKSE